MQVTTGDHKNLNFTAISSSLIFKFIVHILFLIFNPYSNSDRTWRRSVRRGPSTVHPRLTDRRQVRLVTSAWK